MTYTKISERVMEKIQATVWPYFIISIFILIMEVFLNTTEICFKYSHFFIGRCGDEMVKQQGRYLA